MRGAYAHSSLQALGGGRLRAGSMEIPERPSGNARWLGWPRSCRSSKANLQWIVGNYLRFAIDSAISAPSQRRPSAAGRAPGLSECLLARGCTWCRRNVPNLERNIANATIRRRGRALWRSPGRVPNPRGRPTQDIHVPTAKIRTAARPPKPNVAWRHSHKLTVGNPTRETGAIASRISGSDLRSRTDD
jgi:hypothetical protein